MKYTIKKENHYPSSGCVSTCGSCAFFQTTKISSLGLCLKNQDNSNCSALVDEDRHACNSFSSCAMHIKAGSSDSLRV